MTDNNMDSYREQMYSLVSSIMEQAEVDINDLRRAISGWNAEERAMSNVPYDESTLGPVTLQKVDEYLESFFEKRRMSAEPRGRLQVDEDATQRSQSATVQTLNLTSSAIAPVIRRFFDNLTEEQWRELSEGEYNVDMKELLISMCVDVMSVISESVIRTTLQSKPCRTSPAMSQKDEDDPARDDNSISGLTASSSFSTGSEKSMKEVSSTDLEGSQDCKKLSSSDKEDMKELGGADEKEMLVAGVVEFLMKKDSLRTYLFSSKMLSNTSSNLTPERPSSSNSEIKNKVEICLSQAFCDVIGEDIPGRISPEFTEAIVTEVIDMVNPALSMVTQQSLDTESLSTLDLPSIQVSRVRAAKTLAGAILTMQSYLTGGGHEIMRRFISQGSENISISETEAYSSPSSEEISEAVSSEILDDISEEVEADNSETAPDFHEQMRLDGAEEKDEEAKPGSTSPPMSEEDGDDSDGENISIPETEAYSSPSKASEEISEAVSSESSADISEEDEADNSETAPDFHEQMSLDGAEEKDEEAKPDSSSPPMLEEDGEDSERENIIITEANSDSSSTTGSEKIRTAVCCATSYAISKMFGLDNSETSSDSDEQMNLDGAEEKDEEAKLDSTSPPMSEEDGNKSDGENIDIPETTAYSSPCQASEEIRAAVLSGTLDDISEGVEADNSETAPEFHEQMSVDGAEEKDEEAKLDSTSPPISEEDGDDSDGENIDIPETEAYSSPSKASEEIREPDSSAISGDITEMSEANSIETAPDYHEQMRLDGAEEKDEEAQLGSTSPPMLEDGDDSDGENISIPETEAYSSPSKASEEIREPDSSETLDDISEEVEEDNRQTAPDFHELMSLDGAEGKDEEAKPDSTSPPMLEEDGYDSDGKNIGIPETEAYSSPSKASEEIREPDTSGTLDDISEEVEADNSETAPDFHDLMSLDGAEEKDEEAKPDSTSPPMSEEDGDDSDGENISIPETEAYSSPSKASEEIREPDSSETLDDISEEVEEDNRQTAPDFHELMSLDGAEGKDEEAKLGSTSPPMSEEDGDDSDGENISIPETEAYSSPSKASEEIREPDSSETLDDISEEVVVADNSETAPDSHGLTSLDGAEEKDEVAKLGSTSPPMLEDGDDSDGENLSIPETEAHSSPSKASEEIREPDSSETLDDISEKVETDNSETAPDFHELMSLEGAEEKDEEAKLGSTSPPMSEEDGDDSDGENISIPETEAYSSPSKASEEIREPDSSETLDDISEKVETDNSETAPDFHELMSLEGAEEKDEEAQLGSTSPPMSEEDGDDSDGENLSIPETEAYSSPSKASEEIREPDSSETLDDISEDVEVDNSETVPDFHEQMNLEGAEEKDEEAKLGSTSPPMSEEDGDDSDGENISIPETEAYSSPSKASEEIREPDSSETLDDISEVVEAYNSETAPDFHEQMSLEGAEEKDKEAKLGSTSSPMSEEDGDDSDGENISIPETEAYSSPSKASEEIREPDSSETLDDISEDVEVDNSETAPDFHEQINLEGAEEKDEEAKLGSTSPPMSEEDGDDSDWEKISIPETEAYSSPSKASEEIREPDTSAAASEKTHGVTSRISSTSESLENKENQELSEGVDDQDFRERMIHLSVNVMNKIVNELSNSASSESILKLSNISRTSPGTSSFRK
ncbi:uro-adherence factor A-like [Paralichthys olivaceus]|uniref:uro-adherence factor A-like n=1 Tax=Paralichthys olivaceus TaxID=8255 RepID=UPI003752400B